MSEPIKRSLPSPHFPAQTARPSLTGKYTGAHPAGFPNSHARAGRPQGAQPGRPTLLAASAPSDPRGRRPSPPVWTCCLGGADVTHPAHSCRPPRAPSSIHPELRTGPASSRWHPSSHSWEPSPVKGWPSGECPNPAALPGRDKFSSLAVRAGPQSQMPTLGLPRTEETQETG